MVQGLTQLVGFDEFIEDYPENAEYRYELRRGRIIEMPKPRGKHSRVAGDGAFVLGTAIRQSRLAYFIPRECIVKISEDTGYEPDVIVLDSEAIAQEPRWESGSIVTQGTSIKLIMEVVSTNWRDDYVIKLADYEAMGVAEYWIADYLGLGGRRYIGNPKQPTLTVCSLVNGEYDIRLFQGNDRVVSPTFPALNVTATAILLVE